MNPGRHPWNLLSTKFERFECEAFLHVFSVNYIWYGCCFDRADDNKYRSAELMWRICSDRLAEATGSCGEQCAVIAAQTKQLHKQYISTICRRDPTPFTSVKEYKQQLLSFCNKRFFKVWISSDLLTWIDAISYNLLKNKRKYTGAFCWYNVKNN